MEILKRLRKQKGLSTLQVSKIIGYSQKSVENHENGTFLPKADTLQKYADLYEVSISYLLDSEDKSILITEEEYLELLKAEKIIKKIREKHEAKISKNTNISDSLILNDNHGEVYFKSSNNKKND